MADALYVLSADPVNKEAWTLFRDIVTRFGVECHAVPVAFARATEDMDREAFADLYERFSLLFDTLHPAPEPKS